VLLHEFYFRNLASIWVRPPRYVMANFNEHMGSLESWREDFAACARIAGTWAVLVYDPYDDRWHNAALGASDAGGWVGANPLVVCAVADYAWSIDYRDRDAYVDAFLGRIDWNEVAARYHAVDRQ
jgi:Fe-Mn family superoxide dismutase